MLFETVFMIRGGAFGSNFTIQFFSSVGAFLLCVIDWRMRHRKDYFWVFLTGTISISLAELTLQLTGVREMGTKYLFGLPIPLAVSVILQGMAEGGALAILGLCIGDLIMSKDTRKRGVIALSALLVVITILSLVQWHPTANVGGDVPSRRDMFNLEWVIFFTILIVINILWLWWADSAARTRAARMFLVLIVFGTVWTIFEVIANNRWIEVGTLSNLSRAPPLVEFGAFVWDLVVEFGLAMLAFLAIPYLLRLINPHGESKTLTQSTPARSINECVLN
jgi:hypothetical protein